MKREERKKKEKKREKERNEEEEEGNPPVKPVLVIFNFLGVTSIPGHSKGSRSITFM